MNEQMVLDIGSRSIWMAIKLAAPALVATLAAGLLVSIFQAATQINEQTLSFIPKILVMTIAIVYFGPWMLEIMTNFTAGILRDIPNMMR